MKSFEDVLNVLANSHYDMRVLVSKWQELLNPDPDYVEFQFFDGTTYKVPNFTMLHDGGAPELAKMTTGSEARYNKGALIVGNGDGQPRTVLSEYNLIGGNQPGPHWLNTPESPKRSSFGINERQVWGSNNNYEIDKVESTDLWGIDGCRVQGERFELTGTGAFNRNNGNSMPPSITGAWISSNGMFLAGANAENNNVTVGFEGVHGKADGITWRYGAPESAWLTAQLAISGQWDVAVDANGETTIDPCTACEMQGEHVNPLQNLQYHTMSLRLYKLPEGSSKRIIGGYSSSTYKEPSINFPNVVTATTVKQVSGCLMSKVDEAYLYQDTSDLIGGKNPSSITISAASTMLSVIVPSIFESVDKYAVINVQAICPGKKQVFNTKAEIKKKTIGTIDAYLQVYVPNDVAELIEVKAAATSGPTNTYLFIQFVSYSVADT